MENYTQLGLVKIYSWSSQRFLQHRFDGIFIFGCYVFASGLPEDIGDVGLFEDLVAESVWRYAFAVLAGGDCAGRREGRQVDRELHRTWLFGFEFGVAQKARHFGVGELSGAVAGETRCPSTTANVYHVT